MAGSVITRGDQELTLTVLRTDRIFMVGATGSGKTTLAIRLLSGRANVVILDPKHQFEARKLPPIILHRGPRAISHPVTVADSLKSLSGFRGPGPLVYRPTMSDLASGCEALFSWVYMRGGTILYIDEALPLVTTPRGAVVFRPEFAKCVQMGRTRGVGVWTATQRPARVPVPLISEAEHDLIFRLRHADDRKRMADYTDPAILAHPAHGHGFWYYGDKTQTLSYFESVLLK